MKAKNTSWCVFENFSSSQNSSGNRLVYVGGDSKMSDTPWDASGKPKNMTKQGWEYKHENASFSEKISTKDLLVCK